MSQTRKQKVLEQVQRRRRQRTIITFVLVAALIAIIVGVVVFYPRPPPNPVNLPSYLSHCVIGNTVYHSHPHLEITVNGVSQTIPITDTNPGCTPPLHTHDTSGVIHIEPDQDTSYTLGDWFLLWGYWASNLSTATFNSTYVLGNTAGPGTGHSLSMTVNGSVDNNASDFKNGNPAIYQNLYLPRNAETGSDSCQLTGSITSCIPFNIVITYA